jgi:N6-adenosine-specific RNA methylase IME4
MTWPFGSLPRHAFRVIYADLGMRYETWSEKGALKTPQAGYKSAMTVEEAAALPIGELAARNCALVIWIYDPLIAPMVHMIEGWEFRIKTRLFDWRKINAAGKPVFGKGKYSRHGGEQCWLATRGYPKCRDHSIRQYFDAPLREHSRKPDEVRRWIERMFDGPYVELCARSRRRGWAYALSDEIDKFGVAAES